MPAHKLDFYLDANDTLRGLARAARQLEKLQKILATHAPPELTQSLCVKQLREGVLLVSAANAAVATRIKQLSPRLLTAYRRQGTQVTSIRIEVQVDRPPLSRRNIFAKRQLSTESIEKISALADQLEASPLQEALRRLARHGRGEG